jgi:UDP-N-acetylmuramate dehydrogenase
MVETHAHDLPSCPCHGALRAHVPLRDLSTYRIGGTARLLFQPADIPDLSLFLTWALETGLRTLVLGGGSNVLLPDGELGAAVVHTPGALARVAPLEPGLFHVEAGVRNADLARVAAEAGWSGLEFLHDIPGTLGGAAVMNASNNHGETAPLLEYLDVLEPEPGFPLRRHATRDLEFGYRRSPFAAGTGRVVVAAGVRLSRPDQPSAILSRMQAFRAERLDKFPLEQANCGSVFKRPPGDFAGRLVDAAGCKGLRVGDAMVSPRHAGFIVNLGQATAADVRALVAQVVERVRATSGVTLERELIYVE